MITLRGSTSQCQTHQGLMSFASLLGSSHLIHLYFTTTDLDKELMYFDVHLWLQSLELDNPTFSIKTVKGQATQNSGHIWVTAAVKYDSAALNGKANGGRAWKEQMWLIWVVHEEVLLETVQSLSIRAYFGHANQLDYRKLDWWPTWRQ